MIFHGENLPSIVNELDGVVGVAEAEAPLDLHPELAWKSRELNT